MLGAIAGDIIGSRFERGTIKTTDFELFTAASRFTDDSVLTVAIADAILRARPYAECLRGYARRYPDAGYGARFHAWFQADKAAPYGSYGNGAAMRVSAIGFAFNDSAQVLREAAASSAVTHNHPEGIKGAQAVALAILRARQGVERALVREELGRRFGYDLGRSLDQIRPHYRFDVSAQGSVPEALIALFEANDYLDAVRNAISLGGDTDTMACIAGAVAQVYFGIPASVVDAVQARLPPALWQVLQQFEQRYGGGMASIVNDH